MKITVKQLKGIIKEAALAEGPERGGNGVYCVFLKEDAWENCDTVYLFDNQKAALAKFEKLKQTLGDGALWVNGPIPFGSDIFDNRHPEVTFADGDDEEGNSDGNVAPTDTKKR